jgi:ABC-type branched-subunit amino acid transport system substrate-binding protein
MKEGKVTGDPAKLAAERTAVRDVLRSMPPYPALEGPIAFGKNGDALKPVYIIEIQNEKMEPDCDARRRIVILSKACC